LHRCFCFDFSSWKVDILPKNSLFWKIRQKLFTFTASSAETLFVLTIFFAFAYREFDDKNRSVEFHFLPLNKSQRFRCVQPCLDFASNLLVRKCKSKCNVKLLRVVVWKSPKILQKSQKYNITKFIVVILIVTAFLKSVSSLLLSPNLWQSTLFLPFT